jgi:class 3 adenylate cyclase
MGERSTTTIWRTTIAAIVAALVVLPADAAAQSGPGRQMGTGMRQMEERTWPGSGSWMRRQENPERPAQPPQRDEPAATAPSPTPAMPAGPMEHPASALPFYRERTFLVLLGVAVAGGGLLAYRVVWSRRRRGHAPAAFTSEAILVVDLVGSTRLATHYGDGLAMRARNVLKDRTLAAAEGHGLLFAESTGDGHLMTFQSVAAAVETATTLLRELQDRPPDMSPGPALEVRVGISYGEILLDGAGGRHGAAINRAFRLQGVSRESFAQVNGHGDLSEIPDRNRIFLDEEGERELQSSDVRRRFVGFCSLKGFSGLHRVYEVRWERTL